MSTSSPSFFRKRGLFATSPILPGRHLTLFTTLGWVGFLIILPMIALIMTALHDGFHVFISLLENTRVTSALLLSFVTAACAAFINIPLGTVLAWALVRNPNMPGHKILDVIVDLPFALPTAIAGITIGTLYGPHGWIGHAVMKSFGLRIAFTPVGIVVALVFVGLPFVVRTIEPALRNLAVEVEESAAILGATHGQIIRHIILPTIFPTLIAGFGLAFARGIGEYGSVIFIAGNIPHYTEMVSLLMVIHLQQFDYTGAAAIGVITLTVSFACFLGINIYQQRHTEKPGFSSLHEVPHIQEDIP